MMTIGTTMITISVCMITIILMSTAIQ